MIGLLEANELKPGELVGVNKDSYLIYSKLPSEYDNRVKAMELDEKPTDSTNGLAIYIKPLSSPTFHLLSYH